MNYNDLPKVEEHVQKHDGLSAPDESVVSLNDYRRSYYQSDSLPGKYFIENDSGHPPLNDILAAGTNLIFYQKLGVMGDIAAHHLFNVFASSILVFVVVLFAKQTYGTIAAVVAGMSLVTYPLFWSESHFNIKDPPQAAFFALCIWAFWYGFARKQSRWFILSAIAFGVSFGMKFNILFVPFILGFYAFIIHWKTIRDYTTKPLQLIKQVPVRFYLTALIAPIIIAAIFILPWPYLWSNPIDNFLSIFGYYKDIGTGSFYAGRFAIAGFHLYPIVWIIVTTPPLILILFLIGVLYSFLEIRKGKFTPLLWLLWFIVPVIRVVVPGASIYGGIRQIFEYIPAMALIAGLGAYFIVKQFCFQQKMGLVLALVIFIPHILILHKMHPHENVYFNSLIGGLPGAAKMNLPYWGNSFGNAYFDMITWMNETAPENAKFGLVQGTGLNMPRIMLRRDIRYWNDYWSGIQRQGEYMMELTHQDPVNAYPYAWEYVKKTLDPVYEVKVDGVPIGKIWKNDIEHTKAEYQKQEVVVSQKPVLEIEKSAILITLPRSSVVTRMQIEYEAQPGCVSPNGVVYSSNDNGNSWMREIETLATPQISQIKPVNETRALYFFPMRNANHIKIDLDNPNSCLLNNPQLTIFELEQ